MTTYRLMDGLSGRPGNGPASPSAFAGAFLAGVVFSVETQVMWLNGYYHWCPTGGDTVARKFCVWNYYAASSQTLLPGSTVTSGTLTAGAWNFVALASPIQLAPGTQYVASTGWTSVNGFPDTQNQFGTADPYVAGITNGPLKAWSDPSGGGTSAPPESFSLPQGVFSSTLGADPTVNMPASGSNSSNFWVDVQVSDTAPGGYAGSYRFFPNMTGLGSTSSADTANNFTLGMQFSVSQACTVNNVWFYSPPSVTQLPTEVGVYDTSGPTLIFSNSSPSWSGAAGSGWVRATLTGTLSTGKNYKVAVLNGAGTPAVWNNAVASYWSTGVGGSGLTAGPLSAPNNASALAPGQDTYNAGATMTYPATNAGPYHYGLDIEVTPVAPPAVMYQMRSMP